MLEDHKYTMKSFYTIVTMKWNENARDWENLHAKFEESDVMHLCHTVNILKTWNITATRILSLKSSKSKTWDNGNPEFITCISNNIYLETMPVFITVTEHNEINWKWVYYIAGGSNLSSVSTCNRNNKQLIFYKTLWSM